MPVTQHDIDMECEKLYESPSLRDDLNDEAATILLKWGEGQVAALAQAHPDELEDYTRLLRQLLKRINRFVGQREFQDEEGQRAYMAKVTMWLPRLGFESVTEAQLFAALPDDATDMNANLHAILNVLTPPDLTPPDTDATLSE